MFARAILLATSLATGLNRLQFSLASLFSEPTQAEPLIAASEAQFGDSMPPKLRKLLLPLLIEVIASPYLIADSIGMWREGDERL